LEQSNQEEAAQYFYKILKQDPNNCDAMDELGEILI